MEPVRLILGCHANVSRLHQQLPSGMKRWVRQREAERAGARAIGAGGGTHLCTPQPLCLEGFKPVMQLLG